MSLSIKKKLFILVIIMLCIYIIIKILTNIGTNDHRNAYRLGDVVRHYNPPQLITTTLLKYPKSIAAKYIRMTTKTSDFNILNTIITAKCKDTGINGTSNILAVHLRLGDVLESFNFTVIISQIINKGKFIEKSPEYIANYLNKHFRDIPKIIYYGNHTGKGVKQTKNFIDIIRRKTYNCKIVEPSSSYSIADQHLCEMVNAKQFLSTGNSGYAKLIENIRKIRGKETFKIS